MEPNDLTTSLELDMGQVLRPFETDTHLGTVTDTITLSGYEHYSNITISSPTVTTTSYPYPYTGSPYTVTGGAGTGIASPWATSVSPKIRLDGEGADIEVNGESLIGMIKKIEERLNILHPNEKLEAEWAELRELGNRYRELEQHIRDKQATWDRLKAMPPPTVE